MYFAKKEKKSYQTKFCQKNKKYKMSLIIKVFLLNFFVGVAFCYARTSCSEKLDREVNKIANLTVSGKDKIEEIIQSGMLADYYCKIGRSVRISLFDDIRECVAHRDKVELAKRAASTKEEQWCNFKGNQNECCT